MSLQRKGTHLELCPSEVVTCQKAWLSGGIYLVRGKKSLTRHMSSSGGGCSLGLVERGSESIGQVKWLRALSTITSPSSAASVPECEVLRSSKSVLLAKPLSRISHTLTHTCMLQSYGSTAKRQEGSLPRVLRTEVYCIHTEKEPRGKRQGTREGLGLSTGAEGASQSNDLRAWGQYKSGTGEWEPVGKLWGSGEGQKPVGGTWSGELSRP